VAQLLLQLGVLGPLLEELAEVKGGGEPLAGFQGLGSRRFGD